jgi:hypothetical protein
MKQFTVFASKLRIKTLLCSSIAVLLTACGGNVDPGSEQLSATAASVSTDAGAAAAANTTEPAAAVEASAEAAPVASAEAAPVASTQAVPLASTADATAQAAQVTTQAFELTGYGSSRLQAQAGQQDAPIKQ